jgi:Na+/citrate or Na+/malate symporter
MRNNFNDISLYFKKSDGFYITNSGNQFAVIVNINTFRIAEIFRMSANYYEVITASIIHCTRLCEKNFSSALKRVQDFFEETTLHNRL